MLPFQIGFFHRKIREELREMSNQMSRSIDPDLLQKLDDRKVPGESQLETINLDEYYSTQ